MSQIEEILSATQVFIFNNIVQNPIFLKYGLIGLSVNGVLSATILPIPTQMTNTVLLASGYSKLLVFIVLAMSTTTSGIIGYYLGRSGKKISWFLKQHKPKKEQQKDIEKEEERFGRLLSKYGWIAILFSAWIPAAGDVVPIIAGTMRYDLEKLVTALAIGKTTKSIALVYLGSFLSSVFF